MNVQEAIQKRLSIRRYSDASIPADHLGILFKALQFAASGNNYQNWEFVFVKDPEVKPEICQGLCLFHCRSGRSHTQMAYSGYHYRANPVRSPGC